MAMTRDDWKTVNLINEGPSRLGGLPTIARQVTETAREIKRARTAAGVGSILDFGGPAGSSIPSVLANNSAISSFLYTLSRADKLQLFRYFCFTDPQIPITMEDGTEKPLCEIHEGDRVINALGSVTTVNRPLVREYDGEVVDLGLTGRGKRLIGVTTEHPFWVVRKGKIRRSQKGVKKPSTLTGYTTETTIHIDFSPEWVDAGDLEEGDFLLVPKTEGVFQDEFSVEKVRLLGYYLAEGNPYYRTLADGSEKVGINWQFNSSEDELIEEVADLVYSLTGESPSIHGPYEGKQGATIGVRTHLSNQGHVELSRWILRHGGRYSHGKKLSQEAFHLEDEFVKHLVACWLNGDGTQGRQSDQTSGSSVSPNLVHQFYLMTTRIGMVSSKYLYERKGNERDSTSLWIPPASFNIIAEYGKWESISKQFRHRKYNFDGNMLLPIKKITRRKFTGPVYNIETNGQTYDEQSFLVHGLVTHNCRHDTMVGRAIDLHTELPMSRVTIGPPKGESPRQNREITRIYEAMCERLNLLDLLLEIAREYNLCFPVDSLVWSEGGQQVPIGELRVGDLVLTKKGRYRPVLKIHERSIDEEICVIHSAGLLHPLRVTKPHRIFTATGEKTAEEIRSGDILYYCPPGDESCSRKVDFAVDWVERIRYRGKVRDLTVNEDSSYVVENATVHNCGDVYLWCHWDEELMEWDEVYCLPVEYVHSIIHPFNRKKEIIFFAKPLVDTAAIRRITDRDLYMVCLYPYTLIQMASGRQKFIKDVEIGDEVISGDGNIRKVLDVGSRPIAEEIYKISLINNSEPIQITGNHKIHTTRGRIPASEIKKGDLLYFRPPQEETLIPGMSDGKATLVGWFLAEGNLRRKSDCVKGEVFFTLNSQDEFFYAGDILELLEQEFPPEPHWGQRGRSRGIQNYQEILKIRDVKPIKERKKIEFNVACCHVCEAPSQYLQSAVYNGGPGYVCKVCKSMRSIAGSHLSRPEIHDSGFEMSSELKVYYKNQAAYEFFKQFSPETGSIHKQLPGEYITLCKSQQRLIWDSFHLGDGHQEVKKATGVIGGIRFGITSPNLRDQMYVIAARLGINPRRDVIASETGVRGDSAKRVTEFQARSLTRDRVSGEKPTYFLYSSKTTLEQLHESRYAVDEDGNLLLTVASVEKVFYSGPVHNICVDEDHTYHANGAAVNNSDTDIERLYEALGDSVPEELKEALNYGEAVPLNTNWKRGSYCVHLARNRPPNEEYGEAYIERCMDTLLRLENLKNANFQISSRNMAPKHLISAPGTTEAQLNDLRAQVDLSLLENADYPIVTNFEVIWQVIGASDRLLNTDNEYQTLRQDLATGLGTTVDMLTGASTYGGQRITLESMNTSYLRFRDVIRNFVEKNLFRPVAFAKGHYTEEEIEMWPRVRPEDIEEGDILIEERDGHLRRKRNQVNVIWMHSTLRFNRISIRDNAEVYDQLFQLHQKGSLPVRYLLDLHNIDPEESSQALLEDIGTPRDPVFNDFMRALYTATDLPQKTLNETDFMDRVMRGLKLNMKPAAPQPALSDTGGGFGGGMGGGFGGGGGGLGGGPLGDFGGGDPGLGAGMGPGTEGAVPGGPGGSGTEGPAGGADVGAVPGVAASRRVASRRVEGRPDVLPGRLLDPAVAAKLREISRAAYDEGRTVSPAEVRKATRRIENEIRTPSSSVKKGKRRP